MLKSSYYLFQIFICLCFCVVFVKHTKVCLFHICRLWLCLCVVQEPIERRVIEQGMFVKHCKVEVYPMDLMLSQNSDMNTVIIKQFSRMATISKFGVFCCCCFFPGLYCKKLGKVTTLNGPPVLQAFVTVSLCVVAIMLNKVQTGITP